RGVGALYVFVPIRARSMGCEQARHEMLTSLLVHAQSMPDIGRRPTLAVDTDERERKARRSLARSKAGVLPTSIEDLIAYIGYMK
ncbi:MAG TPA: hypothetical protein VM915_05935, partial [Verrucomicrobiae bacterium]|nr:hypothetical protein [Verrucomicrobiae bacterium]